MLLTDALCDLLSQAKCTLRRNELWRQNDNGICYQTINGALLGSILGFNATMYVLVFNCHHKPTLNLTDLFCLMSISNLVNSCSTHDGQSNL